MKDANLNVAVGDSFQVKLTKLSFLRTMVFNFLTNIWKYDWILLERNDSCPLGMAAGQTFGDDPVY